MKRPYFIALCTFVLSLLFASNSFAQDSSTEYRVTFNVYAIHSSRGSIEAFVDGKEIKSKDKVPAGTKVTFKAKPNGGYEVDKWTVRPQQEGLSLKNESTWTIEVKSNITVELRYKTAEGIFHKVNFAVADGAA